MDQKIIILFSSFLCGSPLAFLAAKDNKLLIKGLSIFHRQGKNKRSAKNDQDLFPFYIIFTIIALTLIFLLMIYYSLKEPEPENQQKPKKTINNLVDNQQEEDDDHEKQKKRVALAIEEKKSWKCCLSGMNNQYQNNMLIGFDILMVEPGSADGMSKKMINEILNEDLNSKIPFKHLYKNKEKRKFFENFLKSITQFLKTFITTSLIQDVHQDFINNNINYGILTHMAKEYFRLVCWDGSTVNLYFEDNFINNDKDEQLASKEDETKFNNNDQNLDLFVDVMKRERITFIEVGKEKYYFFENMFLVNKLFNKIYESLLKFMAKHQDKYNQEALKSQKNKIDSFLQDKE